MLRIREAIPDYLAAATLRRSRGWVNHQRTYLEREITPIWGPRRVVDITPDMVEAYVADCSRRLKATTVNKRLSCLRRFFAWLVQRGVLERSPAAAVARLPDDTAVRSETLTRAEVDRLVAVSPPKLAVFVTLAYHTGVRAGEATRLRWSDIELARRRLCVRGEKAGAGRREKRRWIPINDELDQALTRYRQRPEGGHTYLFEHGGRPTWANLNRAFRKAVRAAGLGDRRITPHTLRHTFGAELVMRGVPIRKVQLLMGHSTVVTTESWYAHWSPDWLDGATDVLLRGNQPPRD